MKFSATIENSESIKNPLTFNFEGFTVLTGATGIGKSAVLRAINQAISNPKGNSFIRTLDNPSNPPPMSVDFEFDLPSGRHSLTYTKTAGKSGYYKDSQGILYDKIANIVDLIPEADFRPMDLYGQNINLNYWPQFRPLMFTTQSPEFLYKLLASLLDDKLIHAVQKSITEDISSTKSSIEALTKIKLSKESALLTLSNSQFPNVLQILHNLVTTFKSILDDISTLLSLYQKLTLLQQRLQHQNQLLSYLQQSLTPLIGLESFVSLFAYANQMSRLLNSVASIMKIIPSVDVLVSASFNVKSDAISSLDTFIQRSRSLRIFKDTLSRVVASLSTIPEDLFIYFNSIQKSVLDLQAIYKAKLSIPQIQPIQEALTLSEAQLSEVASQLSQYKVCPLCGSSISDSSHSVHSKETI